MAADFRLKQNLKMSPNAQIKNLVPENLSSVPAESEWKLGRIWFNTSIGKLQGVFLKLDTTTGLPIDPETWEIRIVGADALGPTKDGGYWPDGLFDFTEQTKIADAMDDVNEALKDLSPPEATLLRGDLVVSDQSFISGKISDHTDIPIVINLDDLLPGTEIAYITTKDVLNASLPTDGVTIKGKKQTQFGRADKGTLVIVDDGVDVDAGVDLFSSFNEPSRDFYGIVQGFDAAVNQMVVDYDGNEVNFEANPNKMSYRSPTGALTVNTVERYNDFKKWQRGTGSLSYSVTPGKHSIHVEHRNVSNTSLLPAKTNTLNIFYDPNTTIPTVEILRFENKTGELKYISGIPFYNKSISFEVDFKAYDVFSYTYWDKPIQMAMSGTNLGLLSWNNPSSNLNVKDVPVWNDELHMVNYSFDHVTQKVVSDSITLQIKAGKPASGWGPETTLTMPFLLDTYDVSGNSTPLKETFNDEEYRIDSTKVDISILNDVINNTTGSWDSNISLGATDAQQMFGYLTKATINFEMYNIDIDYSVNALNNQTYFRRFYTVENKPNSNGILKIKTTGIIGLDFDLYIKFPGLTGWLDTKILFDIESFSTNYAVDGVGCGTALKKTSDGYEIPWTCGMLSTYDSGFGYAIQVVLKTSETKIYEIEEISDTWR